MNRFMADGLANLMWKKIVSGVSCLIRKRVGNSKVSERNKQKMINVDEDTNMQTTRQRKKVIEQFHHLPMLPNSPDLIGSLTIQDRKPNRHGRHFKNPDLTKSDLRIKNPI